MKSDGVSLGPFKEAWIVINHGTEDDKIPTGNEMLRAAWDIRNRT